MLELYIVFIPNNNNNIIIIYKYVTAEGLAQTTTKLFILNNTFQSSCLILPCNSNYLYYNLLYLHYIVIKEI